MEIAIEVLRNLAGVMFWALADLFLGGFWIAIIVMIIIGIARSTKND